VMDAASAAAGGFARIPLTFPTIPLTSCLADAVVAGTVCLDRYEASVWRVPNPTTTNAGLVRRIQLGLATRTDLSGSGATQLGTAGDNSASNIVASTGSRSACVSARGAFDMVGNLEEWVADWVPLSTGCTNWGGFSNDRMCLSGASEAVGGPGALMRGGSFVDGTNAGPLTVLGGRRPSLSSSFIGLRCAR
jgi:hypothetical protein